MKKILVLSAIIFISVLPAQNTDPAQLLEQGIFADDAKKIKDAIKKGANPNSPHSSGHLLGLSATYGKLNAVKALVESGADVNQTTSGGWTALMGASDNGHLNIVRFLVSQKVNVNTTTRMGRSALMRASYHGQDKVVKFLLANGAQLSGVDNNGTSALMLAAQQGHIATVKILLDGKADKLAKNQNGKTALLLAQESKSNPNFQGTTTIQKNLDEIIRLLSTSRVTRVMIGKIFAIEKQNIEILSLRSKNIRAGQKLSVKTANGEVIITVKSILHSKIKALLNDGSIIMKGDPVYLVE